MEKRFTLILKPKENQNLSTEIKEHLAENDCNSCKQSEMCPIKKGNITAHAFMAKQVDTYEEIKHTIKHLHNLSFIEVIVLFDYEKDIIHIYKAVGSLHDIKKNVLPPIVKIYEDVFAHEDTFFSVNDIRTSILFSNMSMN